MKFILVFLFLLTITTYPQELNCTISVNTDNLSLSQKGLLPGFKSAITQYMNTTHFTSGEWQGGKINCAMDVFMTSATNSGNFNAQVVVTSQRPIYNSNNTTLMFSINDPNWSFSYRKGQALYQNQISFNPLTSFLDYYAYIIIGFDLDSWEEFGGTAMFTKAINIVNRGASSGFPKGWTNTTSGYNRAGLVDNLLNDKYRPFREAFYEYYYGIDYYEKNKKIGQEKIVATIKTLAKLKASIDFNSVLMRTFFEAKSGEIVAHLKGYPDKNIFRILKRIDPSHAAKYDAALKGNFK